MDFRFTEEQGKLRKEIHEFLLNWFSADSDGVGRT